MKKLFLGFAILLFTSKSFAQAENYTPFRFDIGSVIAMDQKGLGFYLEPKYLIHDNFSLGLRIEGDVLLKSRKGLTNDGMLSALIVTQVVSDYYLGNGKIRPSIGLGFGLFNLASVAYDTTPPSPYNPSNYADAAWGSKFGVTPRIGIDLGHFRVSAEYNALLNQRYDFNRDYLSLKVGFFFGGGHKDDE